RAGAAAPRALLAAVASRPDRDERRHRSLPAGGAAAPAYARLPRGAGGVPEPGGDRDQGEPGHARHRPAGGAGGPWGGGGVPLRHLAGPGAAAATGAARLHPGAPAGGGGAALGGRDP